MYIYILRIKRRLYTIFLTLIYILNNENNLMMFKLFSHQKVFDMKKTKLMLLVAAIGMAGIINSALAADGIINVNGKVIAPTCILTAQSGSTSSAANVTVVLDTIRTTDLPTTGSVAATKAFTVKVTGSDGSSVCSTTPASTITGILLSGTSGTDYDATTTTLLKNKALGADNKVFVRILKDDGVTAIDFAKPFLTQEKSTGTGSVYSYSAQYFANATGVAAQTVTTNIGYTIQYN